MRLPTRALITLASFTLVAPRAFAAGDSLFTVDPCRAIDTRSLATGGPALLPGETVIFQLAGVCGIPSNAKEVAINIAVVAPPAGGHAVVFAGDASAPPTSVLNFHAAQTRASNTIVQLAGDGSGTMALLNASGGSNDYVIDVAGYFLNFCPTITVSPTDPTLPAGSEGSPYSQTFTASGGTGPYTFAITAGVLPTPLNLDPGGDLSGTPAVAGDFSFTVAATDTANCTGYQEYTLHIACGTLAVSITPTPAQVCPSSTGNGASATAGLASYSWLITNGTITSATNTQSITYTAGSSGNVGLTVNVTDASACPGQATLNVPIVANPSPPAITTGNPQTFTASGASGTFTLTFNGQTTSPLAFDATAAQVQTALNALSSIGGAGGSVVVTLAGGFFTVTFGGTLAGPEPQLTASGAGGCTVVVDPPAVCANSTGNQARGPAGAASYAWSITNGAITSATNIQTITYTAGSSGNVGLTLLVTTAPGCAASNSVDVPINANPATPTIAASNPQTFTVSGASGTFTLTFNGQTTSSLAFDATAAAVQTELNGLSSIGGVGGSAAVTQAGGVYTVTFGGTLTGPQPQLTASGAGGCIVVVDPPAVCAGSTGNQARGPAGATTYAWSVTNGTITSATDIQTITYTAGASGNVGLTLVVTNASHCPAQGTLDVLIKASPATPTINPTPAQICANSAGNTANGPAGATTYAWSITNGVITSATNIQTITYTAGASGNVDLTLVVTNAQGCSAQNSLDVPINPIPAFTPAAGALPVATFNVAYSLTFAGTVGTAPFTFALASGALPTGMTLNSNGSVSPNTPSVTGPFAFSITVTDANGCSSTQAYTLNVQPNLGTDAYSGVGNTQLFITGVAGAPTTPAVSSATTVLANDTPGGIAVTAGTTACGGIGGSITMDATGRFIYTPPVGVAGVANCSYTGTSNGVSATQTATIAFNGMVWWVDNATASGTNDGRSNTPFKTMTAVNGAATNNGDFIYAFKGSGTTTGAYTMKPSQHLIGAGATLNVPTIGPLVTIAGVDANTPTIGGTITLAGNVTVAGIDTSTDASNGFAGTSVSGVTVNVRNVATTTGTGVTIGGSGNSGTLQFRRISSNGAVNGISLTNTSGSFTVTGDGESDPADATRGRTTAKQGGGSLTFGSGGTIQNSTSAGILLSNAANVTLRNMTILSNGSGINTGGDGITVSNSSNLSLDNVLIQNQAGNFGLHGTTVSAVTMQHTEISNNATTAGVETVDVWNVRFDTLTGTSSVQNSLFHHSAENVFAVVNTGSTTGNQLTVTNSEFRDTNQTSPGNDGLHIELHDSSDMSVDVEGSTFLRNRSSGFFFAADDSSGGGTVTVNNSSFEQTQGTEFAVAHQGLGKTIAVNFTNNQVRQQAFTAGPSSGVAVSIFVGDLSNATTKINAKVQNSLVGNNANPNSGSLTGAGIAMQASGAGNIVALVDNNVVRQIKQDDALFIVSTSHTGRMDVTVSNNDLSVNTASGFGLSGLDLTAGAVPGDTGTLCVNVVANNIAFIGDPGFWGAQAQTVAGTPTILLEGYGGAANNTAQINAFLNTRATTVNPPAQSFVSAGTIAAAPSACLVIP